MELAHFFSTIKTSYSSHESIGADIHAYRYTFPDWEQCDFAILTTADELSGNSSLQSFSFAEQWRSLFYTLSRPIEYMSIADLGNFKSQKTQTATLEALAECLQQLLAAQKICLIISPHSHIIYSQYIAYESFTHPVQYVSVDSMLDLDEIKGDLQPDNLHTAILAHKPRHLDQFTNLGYQSFITKLSHKNLLKDNYHFLIRYGDLYNQIAEVEPYVRMADMLSIDMSAVRKSEAPAAKRATPGGFSVMEICQLARYAGLGYQLSSFSISGMFIEKDQHKPTTYLSAMICWYIIEGYYNKKEDFPSPDRSNLQTYKVQLHASIPSLTFYQHIQTGRWWMEIPSPGQIEEQENATYAPLLYPCAESDYLYAKEDLIPERWWTIFHKLGG